MMTLTVVPVSALTSPDSSFFTASTLPDRKYPMFMTTSISSAPDFTASRASKALTWDTPDPNGNPTTQQTLMPLHRRCSLATAAQQGATQAEANSYSFASSQK